MIPKYVGNSKQDRPCGESWGSCSRLFVPPRVHHNRSNCHIRRLRDLHISLGTQTTCTSCPMLSTSRLGPRHSPHPPPREQMLPSRVSSQTLAALRQHHRSRATSPRIKRHILRQLARFTSLTGPSPDPRTRRAPPLLLLFKHSRNLLLVTTAAPHPCTNTTLYRYDTSRSAAATESCRESPPFTTLTGLL